MLCRHAFRVEQISTYLTKKKIKTQVKQFGKVWPAWICINVLLGFRSEMNGTVQKRKLNLWWFKIEYKLLYLHFSLNHTHSKLLASKMKNNLSKIVHTPSLRSKKINRPNYNIWQMWQILTRIWNILLQSLYIVTLQ